MNKLLILTTLLVSLFLCSCSDFENEVWINEDGSGKMTMNYDMSPMMSMMAMAEGMEGSDSTDMEEDIKSLDGGTEDLASIFKNFSNPSQIENIDTTFSFYEVMPDSIKNEITKPELLKNAICSVMVNKEEGQATMGLEKGSMEGFKEVMRQYEVDLKAGIVRFPEQDFSGSLADEMQDGDGPDFENMEESERAMMEMMFGDAGISMVVHLPNNVVSCDDESAKVYGNTVIFKDTYLDLMKTKKMKGRVIKFK